VSARPLALIALLTAAGAADARGVSPYLPLGTSPEIDRLIERVLILAEQPVLTRPIAAATVFDALPRACERDAVLCMQAREYLNGYMRRAGVGSLSVGLAAASGERTTLPNRHGMTSDSAFEVSGSLYWQPSDHLLLTVGVLAHDDETTPTGSVASIGIARAQLDFGYRDHWLSPFTDSAMLLGTQAPTMPSVTLSNYEPLTKAGFRYEVFLAEMSDSANIAYQGGLISGNPRLAGVHLSIQPIRGWSIGVNRILQYGGGDRPDSLRDLLDAFVNPADYDNAAPGSDEEFGNQAASFTSTFQLAGPIPLAVYFEYAGEDTSTLSNVRLGNTALSAGIRFPHLAQRFDVTVEASEWQNGWYVHDIYRDGLRHEGNALGHWAADWREPHDGVGGRSLMARVGWHRSTGSSVEVTYRSVDHEEYSGVDYDRGHAIAVRYSHRWQQFYVGAELDAGRSVFGESFSRFGLFFRY